jgi:hypothetical protein
MRRCQTRSKPVHARNPSQNLSAANMSARSSYSRSATALPLPPRPLARFMWGYAGGSARSGSGRPVPPHATSRARFMRADARACHRCALGSPLKPPRALVEEVWDGRAKVDSNATTGPRAPSAFGSVAARGRPGTKRREASSTPARNGARAPLLDRWGAPPRWWASWPYRSRLSRLALEAIGAPTRRSRRCRPEPAYLSE